MKINPVTVTMSKHEMEEVCKLLAKVTLKSSNPSLEMALDHMVGALKKAEEKQAYDTYFGRFWKENQQLRWGEARESFLLILRDRGIEYFADAYKENA